MTRISYMLSKRTTKNEKIEKSLKILKRYNIMNFKTICYILTASETSFIQSSIASYETDQHFTAT